MSDLVKRNELGRRAEHRTEVFLLDHFWVMKLAVDLDGAVLLDQVEDLKSAKNRELEKNSTKSPKKNTKKAKLVIDATTLLGAFLHHYHFAPNSGAKVNVPLTATQIAAAMKWSQPTVSRRMKKLFGPNGMAKYRRAFQGKIPPWLKNLVQERSLAIDAVAKSDNAKDNSGENDLD